MSRLFSSGDEIRTSIGANNYNSAVTIAVLCKFDADDNWNGLTTMLASGGAAQGHGIMKGGGSAGTKNKIGYLNDGGFTAASTTLTVVADGWCLHVVTKADGTATPVYHRYKFSASSWITPENMDASSGNPTAPGSGGGIEIGGGVGTGTDNFTGRIGLVAYWNSVLSTPNIQSLITTFTRANWLSLSPTGLWDELDGFTADRTGNGATQVADTGTADDADDPTGWSSWVGGTNVDVTGGSAQATGSGPQPMVSTLTRPYTLVTIS